MIGTALVGLGPAGAGVLSAAASSGRLDALMEDGLLALEAGPAASGGALGDYHVSSDTTAAVFVETLQPMLRHRPALAEDPAIRELVDIGASGPVDVRTAAHALAVGTRPLLDLVDAHPAGEVAFGARMTALRPVTGGLELTVRSGTTDRQVRARRVILALGGTPHLPMRLASSVAPARFMHSDTVLRMSAERLASALHAGKKPPRVVVIGGSHSAFAVVRRLLDIRGTGPGPSAIVVVHRSPLRITYDDAAAARADGAAFSPAEVCPLTGRVFRFTGLRWRAAHLLQEIRRGVHPTVTLHAVPDQRSLIAAARTADVVIAATGYRSAAAPMLGGALDGAHPGVRVIGLATHRRRPEDGGEASFTGHVDGVWFYHSTAAPRVLDSLSLPTPPHAGDEAIADQVSTASVSAVDEPSGSSW